MLRCNGRLTPSTCSHIVKAFMAFLSVHGHNLLILRSSGQPGNHSWFDRHCQLVN